MGILQNARSHSHRSSSEYSKFRPREEKIIADDINVRVRAIGNKKVKKRILRESPHRETTEHAEAMPSWLNSCGRGEKNVAFVYALNTFTK